MATKTKELTVGECIQFLKELNSMMTEKDVSFTSKYKMSSTINKLETIAGNFDKQRRAIVAKFQGEEKELKGDAEKEAIVEIEKLLETKEKGIKLSVSLADFDGLKSGYPYKIIYKFL